MAFVQREDLTTGELIRETFGVLRDNARAVLIYLAAMITMNVLADANGIEEAEGVLSLARIVAFLVAQYLLFESLLRNAQALPQEAKRRMFRFAGQAFVVLFCVMMAANFFIVPAIILGSRWITAPSLLVTGRGGVFGSLGESWRETSGNTVPLSFASFLLVLLGIGIATVASVVSVAARAIFDTSLVVGEIWMLGSNLMLVGLSVAAYRRLDGETGELAAVFA
jgi:hypothetical protein